MNVDSGTKDLRKYIESTNLSPVITGTEVDQLVREARENNFHGICIPPFWVKRAAREINVGNLSLVTVVGYPLGYQMTETKLKETELAIRDGATEIDLVMNLSAFQDGMNWVKVEIAKFAHLLHDQGAVLKVIVETELWNEDQLKQICAIVSDAGADFFKTSTGYHRRPVDVETISKVRSWLPAHVGIKASGGIGDSDFAQALVEAGADRLGTSKAKKLIG